MYIHSIYTKLFTEDSKFYVYDSQSNFFCEISEQFYNSIQDREWADIPADVFQQLIDKKIIVKKGEEYDFFYSELLRFNMRCYNSSTLNLVLVPTTACNFDCPYCFEPKSNPKVMTSDTITLVKDFISNFKDVKRMSVTWYGGEPLLAFDIIKELSEMLRGDGMPEIISESIVTNGYLFNLEVIEFFKETNLADIQITLDGNKSRHNKTRCLKSGGKPTYDVILDNIDSILKEMPEVNLSIRVNVNKENFSEFIEIYNYFKTKYDGYKNLNLYPGLIREETSDGK